MSGRPPRAAARLHSVIAIQPIHDHPDDTMREAGCQDNPDDEIDQKGELAPYRLGLGNQGIHKRLIESEIPNRQGASPPPSQQFLTNLAPPGMESYLVETPRLKRPMALPTMPKPTTRPRTVNRMGPRLVMVCPM